MGTKQRYAEAESTAKTGMIANACLALIKGVTGGLTGSAALLADAVRSASEAAESFAAVSGLRRTNRQADHRSKPADQSRTGTVVQIFISVVLLLLGLEIAISAIRSVVTGITEAPQPFAALAVMIVFLVKEFLLPLKERGVDLYASILALIGTGGAYLGHLLSLSLLFYLDPAAAVVIAVIVVMSGYRLITRSVNPGRKLGLQEEDADELMEVIQRIEGVITVEELRAWEQGHYVVVDLRISVNPRISVLEGHEIAKRVKELLLKRFIHVTDVTISVDPYDPGYPYRSNHDPNQEHMPTLLQ
ncbi:cation diffusion facilitator family transporter [Paenibacillus abyssi]|uniref:Cation transporter n=1 Tax=Paenibacillus abyssi TaxID=1340531 RepID=A0A917LG10_9BACL|nr:cation transporter [Paenibacillus abyssi]GGG19978.1 cation transporter [Paenibacillus abyssi]